MQKLLTSVLIFYYLININIILTYAVITRRNAIDIINSKNGHFMTMSGDDDEIDMYAKHMAYFITSEELSDGRKNVYKGIGVVIHNRFVLTNLAWDPTKKKKSYERFGIKVKNFNATVYVGSKVFNLNNPLQRPYKKIKSLFGYASYLTKGQPPDMSLLAENIEDTQLTIVIADRDLLSDKVTPIPFAKKAPQPQTECIILTWGKMNGKRTKNEVGYDEQKNLTAIRVRVLDETTCKDELCEYVESLCVSNKNESAAPISSIINGGEPLICKGELWGILRGGVLTNFATPCVGIYDHLTWLKTQIAQTKAKRNSSIALIHYNIFVIILWAFILITM